jgi:very-short-patch-repair endonuclease
MLDRSRLLRRERTEAEDRLWHYLRDRRLSGFKFRSQVPFGERCIADFVCPSAKLIVEVDGSQHVDEMPRDAARTAFLERRGYRVIRFWNNDALARTDAVLEAILASLTAPHPAASPLSLSPSGRGERELP